MAEVPELTYLELRSCVDEYRAHGAGGIPGGTDFDHVMATHPPLIAALNRAYELGQHSQEERLDLHDECPNEEDLQVERSAGYVGALDDLGDWLRAARGPWQRWRRRIVVAFLEAHGQLED